MIKVSSWPWLLLLHALLLQLATFIVRPAAAYHALELGVEPAFLGLIAASFALVPLFIALLIGKASDTGHETTVFIVGAILMVVGSVGILFYSSSLGLLLIWNLIIGLGHLMSVIGQQSRVAENHASKLDSAFGLYTFAGSLGQAAGPALIIVFGRGRIFPDTSALFTASAVACILMLVVTIFLIRTKSESVTKNSALPQKSLKNILRDSTSESRRQVFVAMLVSMVVIGSVDLTTVYLPALGTERGISAAAVGMLLSARAVASMASRFYLGKLVARVGRFELVVLSTAISALAIGALAVPMSLWMMTAVLLISGFALGIGQPITMTMISLAVPPNTRGTWLALRLSANRLGQMGIPAAVGLVAVSAGVAGVFGVAAIAMATTSAVSYILLPKHRK